MTGDHPGVLRWLHYAYGGGLPPRYAQWVLRDLTGRWWLLRHLARTVVQCVPTGLLALLPGPALLRALLPTFVLCCALFVSVCFAGETRNHRLYKHGFVPDMVLPPPPDADL